MESGRPWPLPVGVGFIDTCGSETEEAEFRMVTEVSGKRREQTSTVGNRV